MDSNPELDAVVREKKYDGTLVIQKVTNGWIVYPRLGSSIRTEAMVAITGNSARRLGEVILDIHHTFTTPAKMEGEGEEDGRSDNQYSGHDESHADDDGMGT